MHNMFSFNKTNSKIISNIQLNEYTIIPKDLLINSKYGFKTKGLISYLLSLDKEIFKIEIRIFAQVLEPWAVDAVEFFIDNGYINKMFYEEQKLEKAETFSKL